MQNLQAVEEDENTKEIEKLNKTQQLNYFRQLKIAKETTANKSIGAAAVKIGVAWEGAEKKCVCKKYNLVWGNDKYVSCEFRTKVVEIAKELGLPQKNYEGANWLMTIFALETNLKFKASTHNGLGYYGLIQFGPAAAKDLNTTTDKLKKMTEIDQLDYVKKYFQQSIFKGKLNSLASLYLAVNYPKNVRENRLSTDDVVYAAPSLAYHQNPSFMKEKGESNSKVEVERVKDGKKVKEMMAGFKDGKTYVWEIEEAIKETYQKGLLNKFRGKCELGYEDSDADGWHDPVHNPQINKYEYHGYIKPQSACFGNVRNEGNRFHAGIDLFAIPEITKVYACLDCKFVSSGSCSITLEVIDTKELIEQMNQVKYVLAYVADKEYKAGIANGNHTGKEKEFILNEKDKVYFFYTHLYQQLSKEKIVDENGIVKAGTHIGYTGVEGNADKTHAPHLHFEVRNITINTNGNYKLNPAKFIELNNFDTKEQDDASKKEWRDKAHK
jgi:hypothetical protein